MSLQEHEAGFAQWVDVQRDAAFYLREEPQQRVERQTLHWVLAGYMAGLAGRTEPRDRAVCSGRARKAWELGRLQGELHRMNIAPEFERLAHACGLTVPAAIDYLKRWHGLQSATEETNNA